MSANIDPMTGMAASSSLLILPLLHAAQMVLIFCSGFGRIFCSLLPILCLIGPNFFLLCIQSGHMCSRLHAGLSQNKHIEIMPKRYHAQKDFWPACMLSLKFRTIMAKHGQRGRKDHYVPRGYLRGFIDPARENLAKPFWKFDLETRLWSMESPGSVGWERGFYDYESDHPELVPPDETFDKFERQFSLVRDHILARNFKGWVKQHRQFLLGYMQMMRARSPMFIEQQTAQNRTLRGATITAVGPGNHVAVDSLELRPLPEAFIRNRTITQMREEIERGPHWMLEFNWCLRYTRSPENPFVTANQPLIVQGAYQNIEDGIRRHDTLIFFPLCWQACLVGSRDRFDVGTEEAHPIFLQQFRELFFRASTGYVISPHRLEDEMFAPTP